MIESGSQRRWQALTHEVASVSSLRAVLGMPDSIFGSGTKVLRSRVAWEGAGRGSPAGPIPSLERQLNFVAACSEDERSSPASGGRELRDATVRGRRLAAALWFVRVGIVHG